VASSWRGLELGIFLPQFGWALKPPSTPIVYILVKTSFEGKLAKKNRMF
jgi:hypothetical protein